MRSPSECFLHKEKHDPDCVLCNPEAFPLAPPAINWQERAMKAESENTRLREQLEFEKQVSAKKTERLEYYTDGMRRLLLGPSLSSDTKQEEK